MEEKKKPLIQVCIDFLKDHPNSTPRQLGEATGANIGAASGALTNLYYEGIVDRKNKGTATSPKYAYTLNEKPKNPRKRPAPIPRGKKIEEPAHKAKIILKPKAIIPADPDSQYKDLAKSYLDQTIDRIMRNIVSSLPPVALPMLLERLEDHINEQG